MKNFFKLLGLIILTQTSFAQNVDANLISNKSEINLSFEPNMRGIRNKTTI